MAKTQKQKIADLEKQLTDEKAAHQATKDTKLDAVAKAEIDRLQGELDAAGTLHGQEKQELQQTISGHETTISEQKELINILNNKNKAAKVIQGNGLPVIEVKGKHYSCLKSFTFMGETYRPGDVTDEVGEKILKIPGQRILREIK